MPDAYEIYDGRYVQERSTTSAANALSVGGWIVPAGKCWTVLAAVLAPSVAETQTFWFAVYSSGNSVFPVTWPQELAADPAVSLLPPLVREGMELKLFPGDAIYGYRDAATAGSTLAMKIRFIETDLPLYRYEEPLNKIPSKRQAHGTAFKPAARSSGGGSTIGGELPSPPSGGRGGGNPQPI